MWSAALELQRASWVEWAMTASPRLEAAEAAATLAALAGWCSAPPSKALRPRNALRQRQCREGGRGGGGEFKNECSAVGRQAHCKWQAHAGKAGRQAKQAGR